MARPRTWWSCIQVSDAIVLVNCGRDYHLPHSNVVFLSLAPTAPHAGSKNGLNQDERIDRNANTVMRIGKTSSGTNCKPTEYQDDCRQEDGDDLKPYVHPDRQEGVPSIESSNHYCCGNDE